MSLCRSRDRDWVSLGYLNRPAGRLTFLFGHPPSPAASHSKPLLAAGRPHLPFPPTTTTYHIPTLPTLSKLLRSLITITSSTMPFYNPLTGYTYSVDPTTGALAAVLVPVPGGHVALSLPTPTLSAVPLPTFPTFGKDVYGMSEEVPLAREESVQVDHIVDVVDASDDEDWETELFGSFEETEELAKTPACPALPAGWVPPIRPLETFDWSILTSTTVPEKHASVAKVTSPTTQAVRPAAQAVRPVVHTVRPVVQTVLPVVQTVRPVAQAIIPATQAILSAVQTILPVAQAVRSITQAVNSAAHAPSTTPKVALPAVTTVHPTSDTPQRHVAPAVNAIPWPAATVGVPPGIQLPPSPWTMGSSTVQVQLKADARIRTPTRIKADRMRTDPVLRANLRSVPEPRSIRELMPMHTGRTTTGNMGIPPTEDTMGMSIDGGGRVPMETLGRMPIHTMRTTPTETRRKISGPTALMANRTALSKAALAPAALSQATAVAQATMTLAQATMAYGDAGIGMRLWADHAGIGVAHGYSGTESLVGKSASIGAGVDHRTATLKNAGCLRGDPRLLPRVKTGGAKGLKRHIDDWAEECVFDNTQEDDNPLAKRLKAIHISRNPAYDTRKFAPPTADQRRREERRRAQAAAMVYRMPHFAMVGS
ncbi:hypothetical protein C8Q79DRAFT_203615 [Trametes meyenii]|nr:hypothetical protein C8Q79DRAFT_203615 [Trametes meyenii]